VNAKPSGQRANGTSEQVPQTGMSEIHYPGPQSGRERRGGMWFGQAVLGGGWGEVRVDGEGACGGGWLRRLDVSAEEPTQRVPPEQSSSGTDCNKCQVRLSERNSREARKVSNAFRYTG
jgi:hypothetical protein